LHLFELSKASFMWTKDALQQLIRDRLGDHRFLVVSNREPYVHHYVDGRIECEPPASGMVSALEPIMRACGGIWIANGSGNADRRTANEHGAIRVPPGDAAYTLQRVWLSKQQVEGYYNGLANEGLWPLCHMAFIRPIFEPKHWQIYRTVNELFANAVLKEVGDAPAFVFIQDYHLGLVARLLKERNPNLIVAQFWHIPWPTPLAFQTFPWRAELLHGLLGNDLLDFHLRSHCQNFLDTVDREFEAKIDHEQFEITKGGKATVVRPFPISIDVDEHENLARSEAVERDMERWRENLALGNVQIGIGIDRIDYTKGIPERLRALDRFLEERPEYREKLVFVQVGVPSRTHVPQYKLLDDEVDNLIEEINWRWSTESWRPIVYVKRQCDPVQMMALHRLATFCIVSSLDDGMNLVAKEFVASRTDGDGTLILSRFAGAARELTGALQVNPFAVEEVAQAIEEALTMPEEERRKRMQKMRAAVADNNIYRWAGKLLSALLKFEFPEGVETTEISSRGAVGIAAPAAAARVKRMSAHVGTEMVS
jgi:alpha,alpha-trehalose-phosphate synthase [UDP-forming]